MSKKRIIAIIGSLVILSGIGYGTYQSVAQDNPSTRSQHVKEEHRSKKRVKPATVGLDGKVKSKASESHSRAVSESRKTAETRKSSSQSEQTNESSQKSASSKQLASQQAVEQGSAVQSASTQSAINQSSQSTESKPVTPPTTTPQPVLEKVSVNVYGPISEGNPKWLNGDQVEIKDGDMVIDVLKRDLQSRGMALSYRGTGGGVYIKGINGLFEFDKGPLSGWLYRVNGSFPNHSCGNYPVKSGDLIDWMYTENLGHDRNAPRG